jgi:hypothetical protein
MEFLVLMKLRDEGVGGTEEEKRTIVEKMIIPSIEMLLEMEGEGMLSGGFFEGQRGAAFVMSVQDGETIDNALAALPCSGIFDMEVMPLEPLKEALTRDRKFIQGKKGGRGKRK